MSHKLTFTRTGLLCTAFLVAGAFSARAQNVGIGTTTPASKLTVNGNLAVGLGAPWTTTPVPVGGALIQGRVGIGVLAPGNKVEINSGATDMSGLRFTNLTTASPGGVITAKPIGVDANGDVVLVGSAIKPYFNAAAGGGFGALEPGTGTLVTSYNESADDTNSFVPATGVFTAPESGYYLFNYGMFIGQGGGGASGLQLEVNHSTPGQYTAGGDVRNLVAKPGQAQRVAASAFVKLNAGDTVRLWAAYVYDVAGNSGGSVFVEFGGVKL